MKPTYFNHRRGPIFLPIASLVFLAVVLLGIFVGVTRFDQVRQLFSQAAVKQEVFELIGTGFKAGERIDTTVTLSDGREIKGVVTAASNGRTKLRQRSDDSWPVGKVHISFVGQESGRKQEKDFTYRGLEAKPPPPAPTAQNSSGTDRGSLDPKICGASGGEVGPVNVERWRPNASEAEGGHCDNVACSSACCFTSCQCTGTCGAEQKPYVPPPTDSSGQPSLQGSATCSQSAPDSPACQGDKVWGECINRTSGDTARCESEASNRYLTVLEEKQKEARKSDHPVQALAELARQTEFDHVEHLLREAASCKGQFGQALPKDQCLSPGQKLPDNPADLEKVVATVYANGNGCQQDQPNYVQCIAARGREALAPKSAAKPAANKPAAKSGAVQSQGIDVEATCNPKGGKKLTGNQKFQNGKVSVFLDCTGLVQITNPAIIAKIEADIAATAAKAQVAAVIKACGVNKIGFHDSANTSVCYSCQTGVSANCTQIDTALEEDYLVEKKITEQCIPAGVPQAIVNASTCIAKINRQDLLAVVRREIYASEQEISRACFGASDLDGCIKSEKLRKGLGLPVVAKDIAIKSKDQVQQIYDNCKGKTGTDFNNCLNGQKSTIENLYMTEQKAIASLNRLTYSCLGAIDPDCQIKLKAEIDEQISKVIQPYCLAKESAGGFGRQNCEQELRQSVEAGNRYQLVKDVSGKQDIAISSSQVKGYCGQSTGLINISGTYYDCGSAEKNKLPVADQIRISNGLANAKKTCYGLTNVHAIVPCYQARQSVVLAGGKVDAEGQIIGADGKALVLVGGIPATADQAKVYVALTTEDPKLVKDVCSSSGSSGYLSLGEKLFNCTSGERYADGDKDRIISSLANAESSCKGAARPGECTSLKASVVNDGGRVEANGDVIDKDGKKVDFVGATANDPRVVQKACEGKTGFLKFQERVYDCVTNLPATAEQLAQIQSGKQTQEQPAAKAQTPAEALANSLLADIPNQASREVDRAKLVEILKDAKFTDEEMGRMYDQLVKGEKVTKSGVTLALLNGTLLQVTRAGVAAAQQQAPVDFMPDPTKNTAGDLPDYLKVLHNRTNPDVPLSLNANVNSSGYIGVLSNPSDYQANLFGMNIRLPGFGNPIADALGGVRSSVDNSGEDAGAFAKNNFDQWATDLLGDNPLAHGVASVGVSGVGVMAGFNSLAAGVLPRTNPVTNVLAGPPKMTFGDFISIGRVGTDLSGNRPFGVPYITEQTPALGVLTTGFKPGGFDLSLAGVFNFVSNIPSLTVQQFASGAVKVGSFLGSEVQIDKYVYDHSSVECRYYANANRGPVPGNCKNENENLRQSAIKSLASDPSVQFQAGLAYKAALDKTMVQQGDETVPLSSLIGKPEFFQHYDPVAIEQQVNQSFSPLQGVTDSVFFVVSFASFGAGRALEQGVAQSLSTEGEIVAAQAAQKGLFTRALDGVVGRLGVKEVENPLAINAVRSYTVQAGSSRIPQGVSQLTAQVLNKVVPLTEKPVIGYFATVPERFGNAILNPSNAIYTIPSAVEQIQSARQICLQFHCDDSNNVSLEAISARQAASPQAIIGGIAQSYLQFAAVQTFYGPVDAYVRGLIRSPLAAINEAKVQKAPLSDLNNKQEGVFATKTPEQRIAELKRAGYSEDQALNIVLGEAQISGENVATNIKEGQAFETKNGVVWERRGDTFVATEVASGNVKWKVGDTIPLYGSGRGVALGEASQATRVNVVVETVVKSPVQTAAQNNNVPVVVPPGRGVGVERVPIPKVVQDVITTVRNAFVPTPRPPTPTAPAPVTTIVQVPPIPVRNPQPVISVQIPRELSQVSLDQRIENIRFAIENGKKGREAFVDELAIWTNSVSVNPALLRGPLEGEIKKNHPDLVEPIFGPGAQITQQNQSTARQQAPNPTPAVTPPRRDTSQVSQPTEVVTPARVDPEMQVVADGVVKLLRSKWRMLNEVNPVLSAEQSGVKLTWNESSGEQVQMQIAPANQPLTWILDGTKRVDVFLYEDKRFVIWSSSHVINLPKFSSLDASSILGPDKHFRYLMGVENDLGLIRATGPFETSQSNREDIGELTRALIGIGFGSNQQFVWSSGTNNDVYFGSLGDLANGLPGTRTSAQMATYDGPANAKYNYRRDGVLKRLTATAEERVQPVVSEPVVTQTAGQTFVPAVAVNPTPVAQSPVQRLLASLDAIRDAGPLINPPLAAEMIPDVWDAFAPLGVGVRPPMADLTNLVDALKTEEILGEVGETISVNLGVELNQQEMDQVRERMRNSSFRQRVRQVVFQEISQNGTSYVEAFEAVSRYYGEDGVVGEVLRNDPLGIKRGQVVDLERESGLLDLINAEIALLTQRRTSTSSEPPVAPTIENEPRVVPSQQIIFRPRTDRVERKRAVREEAARRATEDAKKIVSEIEREIAGVRVVSDRVGQVEVVKAARGKVKAKFPNLPLSEQERILQEIARGFKVTTRKIQVDFGRGVLRAQEFGDIRAEAGALGWPAPDSKGNGAVYAANQVSLKLQEIFAGKTMSLEEVNNNIGQLQEFSGKLQGEFVAKQAELGLTEVVAAAVVQSTDKGVDFYLIVFNVGKGGVVMARPGSFNRISEINRESSADATELMLGQNDFSGAAIEVYPLKKGEGAAIYSSGTSRKTLIDSLRLDSAGAEKNLVGKKDVSQVVVIKVGNNKEVRVVVKDTKKGDPKIKIRKYGWAIFHPVDLAIAGGEHVWWRVEDAIDARGGPWQILLDAGQGVANGLEIVAPPGGPEITARTGGGFEFRFARGDRVEVEKEKINLLESDEVGVLSTGGRGVDFQPVGFAGRKLPAINNGQNAYSVYFVIRRDGREMPGKFSTKITGQAAPLRVTSGARPAPPFNLPPRQTGSAPSVGQWSKFALVGALGWTAIYEGGSFGLSVLDVRNEISSGRADISDLRFSPDIIEGVRFYLANDSRTNETPTEPEKTPVPKPVRQSNDFEFNSQNPAEAISKLFNVNLDLRNYGKIEKSAIYYPSSSPQFEKVGAGIFLDPDAGPQVAAVRIEGELGASLIIVQRGKDITAAIVPLEGATLNSAKADYKDISGKKVLKALVVEDSVELTLPKIEQGSVPNIFVIPLLTFEKPVNLVPTQTPTRQSSATILSSRNISNGRIVIDQSGTYLLASENYSGVRIVINASNITLDGGGATLKVASGAYGIIVNGVQNVKVSNLKILTPPSKFEKNSDGTTWFDLHNRGGSVDGGVEVINSIGVTLDGVSVTPISGDKATMFGVDLQNCSGCTIVNSHFSGTVDGVRILGGGNNIISLSTFTGHTRSGRAPGGETCQGCEASAIVAVNTRGLLVDQNEFTNISNAVWTVVVPGTFQNSSTGLRVTRNRISKFQHNAIEAVGTLDLVVSGNTIVGDNGAERYGIWATGGTVRVSKNNISGVRKGQKIVVDDARFGLHGQVILEPESNSLETPKPSAFSGVGAAIAGVVGTVKSLATAVQIFAIEKVPFVNQALNSSAAPLLGPIILDQAFQMMVGPAVGKMSWGIGAILSDSSKITTEYVDPLDQQNNLVDPIEIGPGEWTDTKGERYISTTWCNTCKSVVAEEMNAIGSQIESVMVHEDGFVQFQDSGFAVVRKVFGKTESLKYFIFSSTDRVLSWTDHTQMSLQEYLDRYPYITQSNSVVIVDDAVKYFDFIVGPDGFVVVQINADYKNQADVLNYIKERGTEEKIAGALKRYNSLGKSSGQALEAEASTETIDSALGSLTKGRSGKDASVNVPTLVTPPQIVIESLPENAARFLKEDTSVLITGEEVLPPVSIAGKSVTLKIELNGKVEDWQGLESEDLGLVGSTNGVVTVKVLNQDGLVVATLKLKFERGGILSRETIKGLGGNVDRAIVVVGNVGVLPEVGGIGLGTSLLDYGDKLAVQITNQMIAEDLWARDREVYRAITDLVGERSFNSNLALGHGYKEVTGKTNPGIKMFFKKIYPGKRIENAVDDPSRDQTPAAVNSSAEFTDSDISRFRNEQRALLAREIPRIDSSQINIGEHLGFGVEADVYKGTFNGSTVALRVYKSLKERPDSENIKRAYWGFFQFHQIAPRNSPAVYGVTVMPDGRAGILMDFIEGRRLQQGDLSEANIRSFMAIVAEGHKNGFYFGEMFTFLPSFGAVNLIVSPEGRIYFVDSHLEPIDRENAKVYEKFARDWEFLSDLLKKTYVGDPALAKQQLPRQQKDIVLQGSIFPLFDLYGLGKWLEGQSVSIFVRERILDPIIERFGIGGKGIVGNNNPLLGLKVPGDSFDPKTPIKAGEVFDGPVELAKIKKLPSAQRPAAMTEYRQKLAYQLDGLSLTQEDIVNKIYEYPEMNVEQIMAVFDQHSKMYGFTSGQRQEGEKLAIKYTRQHNRVEMLRLKYPDDRDMFSALFGKSPEGKVEIFVHPFNLVFRIYYVNDYLQAHFGDKDKRKIPLAVEKTGGSYGASFPPALVPGTRDLILIVNNSAVNYPVIVDDIVRHEEQHIINELLGIRPLRINNGDYVDYLNRAIAPEATSKDKTLFVDRIINLYENRVQTESRGELLSLLSGFDRSEYQEQEIKQNIVRSMTENVGYDYWQDAYLDASTLLDKHLVGDEEGTKLLNAALAKIPLTVSRNPSYRAMLEKAIDSYFKLRRFGYSYERAFIILKDKSLTAWPREVERVLGQKNEDEKSMRLRPKEFGWHGENDEKLIREIREIWEKESFNFYG